MKYLCVFFCLIGAIQGTAQTTDDISQIVFLTTTRGYSKQVTVSSKTLDIRKEDRKEGIDSVNYGRKLTKAEWKQICESLKGVSFPEIPTLESPTVNRAFDGARYSSLTFTLKNGRTFSHSFDNENPHQTLQPLMGVIGKISSKK